MYSSNSGANIQKINDISKSGTNIYESLTIDYIICCFFKVFKHLAVHSTNGSSLSQLIYCPVWNIECTISCRTVSSISSFESLLPSGFFVLIVIILKDSLFLQITTYYFHQLLHLQTVFSKYSQINYNSSLSYL